MGTIKSVGISEGSGTTSFEYWSPFLNIAVASDGVPPINLLKYRPVIDIPSGIPNRLPSLYLIGTKKYFLSINTGTDSEVSDISSKLGDNSIVFEPGSICQAASIIVLMGLILLREYMIDNNHYQFVSFLTIRPFSSSS